MSLPSNWVEKIFVKMTLMYGHEFTRRWDGVDIKAVKADWAHELSRFQQSPSSIEWALQNLPEKPPNAAEFRSLCFRVPAGATQMLPAPRPRADVVRRNLESIREAINRSPMTRGRLEWAERILERHARGETVRQAPLQLARDAIAKRDRVSDDEPPTE